MPLADDIQALRERVLADLTAAHDYYTDTKIAWRIVHAAVKGGTKFANRNTTTGTLTTQADLVGKAPGYIAEQLAEATFLQFVSIFENFFFHLLRIWLAAYPQSLSEMKVVFQTVLDAPDKEAIVLHVVNRKVNDVLYDRPAKWFAYLEKKARLGCPTDDEVERIAEAKASRDVLVHHQGVANKTYESKAGTLARYRKGERIDIPEPYHRQTWELLRKVVTDVSNAAMAKAP